MPRAAADIRNLAIVSSGWLPALAAALVPHATVIAAEPAPAASGEPKITVPGRGGRLPAHPAHAHPLPLRDQVHRGHRRQAAAQRPSEQTRPARGDPLRRPLGRQRLRRGRRREIGRRCVRQGRPHCGARRQHTLPPAAPGAVRRRRRRALPLGVRPQPATLCGEGAVRRVEAPLAEALPRLFVQGRIKEALLRAARDSHSGSSDAIGTFAQAWLERPQTGSDDRRPRRGSAAALRRQAGPRQGVHPDQARARPHGERRDRHPGAGRVREQRRRRDGRGGRLRADRRREGAARGRARSARRGNDEAARFGRQAGAGIALRERR